MANKLYEETNIQAIANAIRAKGQTGTMTVAQMPSKINAISTKETVSWDQCPAAVMNYLDNVDYTDVPYTESYVQSYIPASGNNTKPIGITVDGVIHYNEVPKIETPFSSNTVAGTLKPLNSLRWIKSDTANMRDIGGWLCDGGTVKYGMIFRGGAISITDEDLLLNQLKIRQEIDLRGADESTSSVFGNKIRYVSAEGADVTYTLSPKDSWKLYLRALFDSAIVGDASYIHCSMGADRTGTFACVIEGLLGVAQNDCDKDYELTSFVGTSGWLRERNGQFASLISQINQLSGTTFRDKCVNFVASLGFTESEINAFRAAMIDGYDPDKDDVTLDVDTFTVTNNLSHATSDNSATSVTEFQPYEASIMPASGYAISSVQILMNGIDITAQVWNGTETNLYRPIQKTLAHCTIDNTKTIVVDNESFAAEITTDDGYTLDGATVSITMGGVDITNQVWMTKEDI